MRPSFTNWKVPFACAVAVTGLPLALLLMSHHAAATSGGGGGEPTLTAAPKDAKTAPVEISLADALGRRWLQAEYRGDGRSQLRAAFVNKHNVPLRVLVDSGTIFETSDLRNQMVVARGQAVDLPAGVSTAAWFPCAATRSTNVLGDQNYHLCPDNLQNLRALFTQVDRSPEFSRDAIQCAVLMLTENAPLNLFAKFTVLSGDQPTKTNSPAYKVDTAEILGAFTLVKDAGYSRTNLVAAQEGQLKIEAMIDPLAHSAAIAFYNLNSEQEWTYWRDELQKGDASTRHYALYGIGRYYPDVALQMLPDWARATQVPALMRASAIQAMAETHRPEAISVLQQLVSEFGAATELGASARKAIAYLENQRAAPAAGNAVEFRLSQASLRETGKGCRNSRRHARPWGSVVLTRRHGGHGARRRRKTGEVRTGAGFVGRSYRLPGSLSDPFCLSSSSGLRVLCASVLKFHAPILVPRAALLCTHLAARNPQPAAAFPSALQRPDVARQCAARPL